MIDFLLSHANAAAQASAREANANAMRSAQALELAIQRGIYDQTSEHGGIIDVEAREVPETKLIGLAACPDCTQAAAQQWDCYSAGCAGCEKRMLARMVDVIAASQIKEPIQESDHD